MWAAKFHPNKKIIGSGKLLDLLENKEKQFYLFQGKLILFVMLFELVSDDGILAFHELK